FEKNSDSPFIICYEDYILRKIDYVKKFCTFLNVEYKTEYFEESKVKRGAITGNFEITKDEFDISNLFLQKYVSMLDTYQISNSFNISDIIKKYKIGDSRSEQMNEYYGISPIFLKDKYLRKEFQNKKQSQEIKDASSEIERIKLEIENKNRQLVDIKQETYQQSKLYETNLEEIQNLRVQLKRKNEIIEKDLLEIENLSLMLKEKDAEVQSSSMELVNKNRQLENIKQEADQQNKLNETNLGEIKNLGIRIKQKSEIIEKKQLEIENKSLIIEEKDAEIELSKKAIDSQNKYTENLKNILGSNIKEINALRKIIENSKIEMEKQNKYILDFKDSISSMSLQIERLENKNSELTISIDESNSQINDLKTKNSLLTTELSSILISKNSTDRELSRIKNSLGHKIIMFPGNAYLKIINYSERQIQNSLHLFKPGLNKTPKKQIIEKKGYNIAEGFILITSLYNEKKVARQAELLYCLDANLRNPEISQCHIVYDQASDDAENLTLHEIRNKKGVTIEMAKTRPSFSKLFNIARNEYSNHRIIICNSDIYFDKTLALLKPEKFSRTIFCFSRKNDQGDHKSYNPITNSAGLPNNLSADAWMFFSSIPDDFYADYGLGTMYSDSFLNNELLQKKYSIINPCHDINVFHLQNEGSESQQNNTAKRAEFEQIILKESNRIKKTEVSVGIHWSSLLSVEEIKNYNLIVRWTKKNIILDVRAHDTKIIMAHIKDLNQFSNSNTCSIWLLVDDISKWLKAVLPVRSDYVNVTEIYDSKLFVQPKTMEEILEAFTGPLNVFIRPSMVNAVINTIMVKKTGLKNISKIINRKPKLYIDVQFGLCNRLRALASASVLGESTSRELVLIWNPDVHCDTKFSELFDNHLNESGMIQAEKLSEMEVYDYMNGELRRSNSLYINCNTKKDIYIRSAYTLDYGHFNKAKEDVFLRQLVANKCILEQAEKYSVDNMIGIHIRMGGGVNYDKDKWDSDLFLDKKGTELMHYWRERSHYKVFEKKIDELLSKDKNTLFYIAADQREIYEVFTEKYNKNIVFHARDTYDRSYEQQIMAMIDLYVLSRTKIIYGSNWSSFSEVASRIGGNKLFLSGIHF
ncbi:MAG: hypothetical protein KKG99_12490, partial [Bacteroidetes bacterium]|nr:hypothetical protein [Bacteroidota bacterium]